MRAHHVAQGFTQQSLENLPGWRLHNFSWQPLPLLPNDEKGFPYLPPEFLDSIYVICLSSSLEQVAHISCGVSSPGDIQNSMDTVLDNLLQLILFEQGGWARWSEEVPFNLNDSEIL